MLGKFNIQVSSKKLKYDLCVQRKITIIRGDSGTGKTTFVQMVLQARRPKSPFTVTCEKRCIAFTVDSFTEDTDLTKFSDCILFFDEDIDFIRTKEFAEIVKESDCYFVLVTRERLDTLPYSCKEIYQLKRNTLVSFAEEIENSMHKLFTFSTKPKVDLRDSLSCIIVEDTNAGYEFFKTIADRKGIDCISAGGNSNVSKTYKNRVKQNKDTGILVIVDGAAFGAHYERLSNDIRVFFNTVLYLPESFEYLVLISDLFKDEMLDCKLDRTYDYADSKMYFSWERYYTELLIKISQKTGLDYSKKKLNPAYLIPGNFKTISKLFVDELGLK